MQSEQHWELMIVDDHSSDNSLNIVKNMPQRSQN